MEDNLTIFARRLRFQCFNRFDGILKGPSRASEDMFFPPNITLQSKGKLFLVDRPWIMGILNMTPDSFFGGSRIAGTREAVLQRAERLVREGADILDIGGYSSRPGAGHVSLDEEIGRTVFSVREIKKAYPNILVSIDTFRAELANLAVEAGADIVNDISAGELDSDMIPTVGKLDVPYVAMHMRSNPKSMQQDTAYENPVTEIARYFSIKIESCRKFGIKDVIIDPGFGFSKTLDQNYEILKNLAYFKTIECLLLVGLSRKSMIYKKLDIQPEDALNGTTALHMFSLLQGANILRVHDVKAAKETIELYKQLYP